MAAVAGDRQGVAGGQRARDDVHALRAQELLGAPGVAEHEVRPRPRGVDHEACAQFGGGAVRVPRLHADDRVALAEQLDDLGVVEQPRAGRGGREQALEREALGREHLAVVVGERAGEALGREVGLLRERGGGPQHAMSGQALVGVDEPAAVEREEVVDRESGAQQGQALAVAAVHRQQHGQGIDQVRGGAQPHPALAQGLADEADLEVLEVAQAAVDELGGRRAGRM